MKSQEDIPVWTIEGIVAVGVGGRLLQDLAGCGVHQLDAHAANAGLPGILAAVRVLVEPDAVPDPIRFWMKNLFPQLTSAQEIGDRARILAVKDIHKAGGALPDVQLIDPGREAGPCLGTGCKGHVADGDKHGRKAEQGWILYFAAGERIYIRWEIFKIRAVGDRGG